MTATARYDEIGLSYHQSRQPDPRIAAQVRAALGHAQTIVNVGAGAGSYEPSGRRLAAVEPSAVMLAQRPATAAPGVRAVAEALPFGDQSFDAGLAILTVHHWSDAARGLAELRRVAARIVILTTEAERINRLWLTADYFPGSARARRPDIQPRSIAAILGGEVRIETVLVPHDCTDGLRLLQRELQRRHLPDWDLYCRVYIMLVHERHRVLGGNVRQLGGLYDKRIHWFWCRSRVPLQPVSDGAKASSR